MYMSLLICTFFLLSVVAPFSSTIITLGGILILMAIISTLLVSFFLGSWFGFILFLIYITGLLVLFGYMMAMSPNNFNSKLSMVKNFFVVGVLLFFLLSLKQVGQLSGLSLSNNFEEKVVQIYSVDNLVVYWLMALVLLVALLMSVNICYKAPKPLRSFLE